MKKICQKLSIFAFLLAVGTGFGAANTVFAGEQNNMIEKKIYCEDMKFLEDKISHMMSHHEKMMSHDEKMMSHKEKMMSETKEKAHNEMKEIMKDMVNEKNSMMSEMHKILKETKDHMEKIRKDHKC